jgi:2-dehydropantoate 2-reductase
MEIDALITAVQELGQLTNISTPTIDILLTLVQEKARQINLYN